MKRILTYTLPLTLSACMMFSDVEKQALHDSAITDARKQTKAVHLAYLQCYALEEVYKKSCEREISAGIEGRKDASIWEYILPFDYEAERLGFAVFLRDHKKACNSVNEGPKYARRKNAYTVQCTDGHSYAMRFDSNKGNWSIIE